MTSATHEPGWVAHAIWWHAYPLGFTGAEGLAQAPDAPARHRLPHLAAWLDHLVGLGASGLLLGPVFDSESHGYDTVDHLRIDPRLGDEADLAALIAEAHERGVRVMLDGVFNHVGRSHPAFAAVLAEGPSAPTAGWFRLRWPGGAEAWTPGIEPDYDDFEGHRHLVALDHSSPAVVDHVVQVMTYWLDRGVDAWRLDAAYAVPASFWAEVSRRVRATHPDAYLMGEVIHGDYAGFVADGGLDAVTQYELWKAVWSSLNDRNLHELAHALGRHDAMLASFVPFTFVGNHDVTRIASRLTDRRHLAHATVLLATLPGTPAVYSGDELGLTGVKEDRAGGDDAVRPVFPDQPGPLDPDAAAILALHRQLLGLRRRHAWLHRARVEVTHVANETIVYVCTDGDRRLAVALSTSDGDVGCPLPSGSREVLAGHGTLVDHATTVLLPSHGWCVIGA
ncbi:alpha-amylase family glycosyl hydrolase [Demequina gelatinilytica]|uniref:alpha-amylase family glycosyl hydrolase n=1 Tax=Demequina gelatinilytica TaxID=1638980 RepID=UPI0007851EFB|nr:alpha-amylase family glycosyl hydrolase [Demequina gelatinilytica]